MLTRCVGGVKVADLTQVGKWPCAQLDDVTCIFSLTPFSSSSSDCQMVQSSKLLSPLPCLPPSGMLTGGERHRSDETVNIKAQIGLDKNFKCSLRMTL